ncbi:hypothetical protein OUZ56_021256 [Daphnia magna]|uniref:Uncharacterized protein n=1 Tax=Daphnia magna TaxID=35525 RepID=A0ABQ9ZGU8_9CRUS|nr:hypothetical protein OUZ56_021256 [Daphnia magna]
MTKYRSHTPTPAYWSENPTEKVFSEVKSRKYRSYTRTPTYGSAYPTEKVFSGKGKLLSHTPTTDNGCISLGYTPPAVPG